MIAVNLAVALANSWKLNVGLLDADIYGPSIPTMMNLHQKPDVSEGITPFLLYFSVLWVHIFTIYISKIREIITIIIILIHFHGNKVFDFCMSRHEDDSS